MDATRLTPAALHQRIYEDPDIKGDLESIRRFKITTVVLSILGIIGLGAAIAAISVFGANLVGGLMLVASYSNLKKAKQIYTVYTYGQGVTNTLIEAKKQKLQSELM